MTIAHEARTAAGILGPPDAIVFAAAHITAPAEQIAQAVTELADAGAHRVAVCALSPHGPPDGTLALVDFAATLRDVQTML